MRPLVAKARRAIPLSLEVMGCVYVRCFASTINDSMDSAAIMMTTGHPPIEPVELTDSEHVCASVAPMSV